MDERPTALSSLVARAGKGLKWAAVLSGLCWWLAVCLGLWLALFVFDNLLSLPAGLRLPLALGGGVFSAVYLFRKVLKPALHRQRPERTAVMLEARYGIRENLLINAVQFEGQPLRPEEQAFAWQTIQASAQFTDKVRFGELWGWRKLRVWGVAAGTVLLLWLGFIAWFPRQFSSAGARFLLPLGDVPPPGSLALKMSPASDVVVTEGDNLAVALEVESPTPAALAKPPLIVWQDRADFIQPVPTAGENAAMQAEGYVQEPNGESPKSEGGNLKAADAGREAGGRFGHAFANIQTPFAFRVFAGDSFTRSIHVNVRSLPRLRDALFRVRPPAYTGQKAQSLPGPPGPVAALPGSELEVSFIVEPPIKGATWIFDGKSLAMRSAGGRWSLETTLARAGGYEIQAAFAAEGKPLTLARGEAQLLTDNPPEVDFITEDRNRLAQYGETLKLIVQAHDDFGVADLAIVARPVEKDEAGTVLKRWTYLGPPGNPGPLRETHALVIDPRLFEAGVSYYLEALAHDFRPGGAPSRSRPILLRVKSEQDMALRDDDPLAGAFDALKQAVAAQEKANHLAANLETYLDDVVKKRQVGEQALALSVPQREAERHGKDARDSFRQRPEGKPYVQPLSAILDQAMPRVFSGLRNLESARRAELTAQVRTIENQQDAILADLLNLLGKLADARSDKPKPASEGKDTLQPPALAREARAQETLQELKDFLTAQERVLEKSRTLADKNPEDLTQGQQEILGELSREEEKWAKFLEEKLTDFSKLPNQDFADASMAQEFNQVFQEVRQAADALQQKNMELAVPHEQSGLENAQELVNNLERWLPDSPDKIKWNMEEPLTPADIAMAELPRELEDIVGELLDKEEEMTPEVEDVTSSWMDSIDKGAGWGAGDGPISSMSAKGVTGNQLPNQNEVGGRSGEGRTGRSHGQMVSDTAEGKGGRETPTRLTPEPFEQGSVKDAAKNDQGGATGGGKLSGFTGEGLRGPAPPPANQKLPRLADQQARIRQQAEALALKLRRYRVPSGGLETSIAAMNQLEASARKNDGLTVRRAFNRAVDALGEAKQTVHEQAVVKREQNKLPTWMREEIRVGVQEGIPKGYEEMVGEYFRALAEGRTK
jgi:hypothetical protein